MLSEPTESASRASADTQTTVRLSLNIVAVFLSVTIWSWLWGMPGALMAVPILVVVKVICDHVQRW